MRFDSDHVGWGVLRFCGFLTLMTLILWLNSTSFDDTEVKTIGAMAVVAAASEGLHQWLARRR